MKEYFKGVAMQATAILITAVAAAGIAFFQTLLVQGSGIVCPEVAPEQAGVLGAVLKSAHTAFMMKRGIMST